MSVHLFCIITTIVVIVCEAQPGNVNEIPVPQSYSMIKYTPGTYSNWIQSLPLKPDKIINSYRGETVNNEIYNIFAVINMPLLFNQDLEQSADFCFRFWAEYHQQMNTPDKLYLLDYNGNKKFFKESNRVFKVFLRSAMSNTNSYCIKNGCENVSESDLKPGDMIVQNEGSGIGHVSIVMNVCKSEKSEHLYLIGFSNRPAQEFHIEKAMDAYGKQGWFTLNGYREFLKNNLDLGTPVLRRFGEGQ
jgi:hypothetical protein